MTDWTSGYVADIGYTYGYYGELNPQRSTLAFLNAGLVPPKIGVHCELGFGQGISVNIHAAASTSTWFGTDFNPSQAGFARALAEESAAKVFLFDQAFDEFCNRQDLPDFDSISLHGIWSWISDQNRAVIVDFLKRKLKVGGLVYISYNTQPGWAPFIPMRDLMSEHKRLMGVSAKGVTENIGEALGFVENLLAANPDYLKANPQVANWYAQIKDKNRNYLAHEYFNRDWCPMSFSKMAEWLSPAKLDYACSADYLDSLDQVKLTAEQKAFIDTIPDPMFRQQVRDFCVNQRFRRDYWVKGGRKIDPLRRIELARSVRVVLVHDHKACIETINKGLGGASVQENVYQPILETLKEYRPKSLSQIEKALSGAVSFNQLMQAVLVMVGTGVLDFAQEEAVIKQASATSERLNTVLMDNARCGDEISVLASPVTGGGISANRIEQLAISAIRQGLKQPEDWARAIWQVLASQGQTLLKGGKPIETAEENLAQLTEDAKEFSVGRLNIFKGLQVV